MVRYVYADNAATTKMSKKVINAMIPCLEDIYGNPSSLYKLGTESRSIIEKARNDIASCLNADSNEIYFTSGGSESDNWAIKGIMKEQKKLGKNHIITSAFEHHAVLHSLDALKSEGFEVTYLDVHENGIISLDELKSAIKENTGLVTIMTANNEIGTIQPIKEIGQICRENKIIVHTDAVQAIGNVHIDVKNQNIDLLSLSGHKFHGPKGIGALYIRKGIRIKNYIDGGAQERNKRAGTENIAGIVGLATAMVDACKNIDEKIKKVSQLRDRFIDEALKIERSRLNGDRHQRLPGNVNMCFEGIEGESLLLMLDLNGISASSGSACTSGSLDPSHVLLSIGLPHEIAHGSLRLSFNEENTIEDIEYILKVLPGIVQRLRNMSPLWERIKNQEVERNEK